MLVAVASAAVVVVAGCSGSSSGGHAAGPGGIRGTVLPAFSCAAKATGEAIRVAPDPVVQLRICPLSGVPKPFGRPKHQITLTRGSTRFEGLLNALSLPDQSPTPNQVCPAYAELRPPILATTGTTALLVHVPVDGCNHSLPAVSAALAVVLN